VQLSFLSALFMLNRPSFSIRLLHPRYWLIWLGVSLWWLISQLPHKLQMMLGTYLGHLLKRLGKKRVAIAQRNLELCFPQLSVEEQKKLLTAHFDSLGKAFFETGIAWFWSRKRLAKLVTYDGLEHLKEAQTNAQGILLMTIHYTHLDLGASFINLQHSIDGSYKQHDNALYDWVQRQGRERLNADTIAIERDDVRSMIKHLRRGRAIWYAPDQDYRAKQSIFVPFFGVPAATIIATSNLARVGQAKVIYYTCIRKPNGKYHVSISSPLNNFPTDNIEQDTKRIMGIVEESVLLAPEQYLWVHKRFKNRPPGEPKIYQ
jgi:Kdo2-lipid IVA lauroyltransferase/acyltransferase